TRATLERILRGGDDGKAPALLFTASHGLGGLPLGDERLIMHTGSLVLGDWSGFGNVKREHWFAGEDLAGLSGGPKVEGSLAFLFACYGAGCPAEDEFIFDDQQGRPRIATFPLISQLPQQLLVNGALGVLGHIERAWTYSFTGTEGAKAQSQPFEDVLGRLMQGRRLGDATDQFNVIQGARAQALVEELENIKFGKTVEPLELSKLWMARNDARNYALLGDPAAKLPY
ncbi:MAG: peptidase C1, partial [Chloroflexales bacterium]|nr:peptidase C1 [Chloroflexales bacterium]